MGGSCGEVELPILVERPSVPALSRGSVEDHRCATADITFVDAVHCRIRRRRRLEDPMFALTSLRTTEGASGIDRPLRLLHPGRSAWFVGIPSSSFRVSSPFTEYRFCLLAHPRSSSLCGAGPSAALRLFVFGSVVEARGGGRFCLIAVWVTSWRLSPSSELRKTLAS